MDAVICSLETQFVIFFIVISINGIRAQQRAWPVRYRLRDDISAPVREGYIVLKDNDTLRGFIKLLPITFSYPILDTAKNKITDAYIKDITTMRVYANSPEDQYTDFINLHYKHNLWRLDRKVNNMEMYDNVLNSGITKTILITPGKRIKLYSAMTWFLHGGNMDNLLLRFIRKSYKISFKEEDFRATIDIINYILDRENEKELRSSSKTSRTSKVSGEKLQSTLN